jgi:hypothetical protein
MVLDLDNADAEDLDSAATAPRYAHHDRRGGQHGSSTALGNDGNQPGTRGQAPSRLALMTGLQTARMGEAPPQTQAATSGNAGRPPARGLLGLGSLTGQDRPGRSADGRGYFCQTTLAGVSLGADGHVVRSTWGWGKAVGAWLGHAGRAERLDRGQRLDQEPPAGHLTDADRTPRARSRVAGFRGRWPTAPDREACGRCQAQTAAGVASDAERCMTGLELRRAVCVIRRSPGG